MSEARRAIEALRAGVPNRSAIRLLGTSEADIHERFLANLRQCGRRLREGAQVPGQVIAGGFGTGKSHLLGYLQELALNESFIVSWVVISKENPLFDPAKLLVSAMRNAAVARRNDDGMTAVISKLLPRSPAYEDLSDWAESDEADLSPIFSGILRLIPHPSTDPERTRQIARFLAGGKLNATSLRQWLREAGMGKLFQIKPVKQPELVRQRLRFLPRLIAAAGFSGWVVLFDEVELIGRYSILQRARSYAELARWLGLDANDQLPGVVAVAAITDDFAGEVIGKRRDDEQAPLRLVNRNERKAAELARLGIEALERKQALLKPPTAAALASSLERVRGLYTEAYGWQAPLPEIGDITATRSMRQYIKSWITTWDLARLYGSRAEIETVDVPTDYEENTDIERAPEPSGEPDED